MARECVRVWDPLSSAVRATISSDHSMETEEEVIPRPPVVSDPVTPVPISSQRCHKCNRRGHFARECPNIVCFNCDNLGHTSKECPKILYLQILESSSHQYKL